MNFGLSDVIKILGLKARYSFCAWVFGSLLLFLPIEIKEQMGVTIPDVVRPWVGFTTLAAFVLWLVLALLQVLSILSNWFKSRKLRTEILSQLETLSSSERAIFIICLSRNQRTINRNITDSAANSLKAKRLLVMAPQGSILSMPHTIPKFVWDYLKKNEAALFPELFDEKAMREFERSQEHGWMR